MRSELMLLSVLDLFPMASVDTSELSPPPAGETPRFLLTAFNRERRQFKGAALTSFPRLTQLAASWEPLEEPDGQIGSDPEPMILSFFAPSVLERRVRPPALLQPQRRKRLQRIQEEDERRGRAQGRD